MKATPTGRRVWARAGAAGLAAIVLAGCASAASDQDGGAQSAQACAAPAMATLRTVLVRVYREGIFSERTASAEAMIEGSPSLRKAVEAGNAAAVKAAGEALIHTGHMTDLRIVRAGRTLAALGGSALTPLKGIIKSSSGAPIATYSTSVWSDKGLVAESSGIAEGQIAIQQGATTVDGTTTLTGEPAAAAGTLTHDGATFAYTSFAGKAYPDGAPVRIYLLRPLSSLAAFCGSDDQDTSVNTITHVAREIYQGEIGGRTDKQIRRVQANSALLKAVASGSRPATRLAIIGLLNQHIVRLRVLAPDGSVLADVGGSYVLGPVGGPLTAGGRTIGRFLLSIQDDEGYKRLVDRLAGLDVVMYMDGETVKNDLGPDPGPVPVSGPYTYRGHNFTVFTLKAAAFPSGTLTIRVLIPLPYPQLSTAGSQAAVEAAG